MEKNFRGQTVKVTLLRALVRPIIYQLQILKGGILTNSVIYPWTLLNFLSASPWKLPPFADQWVLLPYTRYRGC